MQKKIKLWLEHPLIRGLNIDSPESIVQHSCIIQSKPFLKKIYSQWYTNISESLPVGIKGDVLELGTSRSFLENYIPGLIKSEILKIPNIHIVFDGQFFPFAEASFRGIVMVDVFHHIPSVRAFLREAVRCVKPGGTIVMVDQWTTPWSQIFWRYMHHEPFDPDSRRWSFPKGGPLSMANMALPWIVFHRDRKRFEREFPELQIKEINLHTPFCYLLSGGVSFRGSVPGFLFGACRFLEDLVRPWIGSWAMFATIVLVRK